MEIKASVSTPRLDALMAVLSQAARKRLFRAAAGSVAERVKAHLTWIARTRHKTAQGLGAEPTGHLRFKKEGGNTEVSVESAGFDAYVAVRSPGFRRVYEPIEILPVVAKALTIPVHALAYGKRVPELRHAGIAIFRPKGADYLAYSPEKGKVVPLYVLARRTLLKQDRNLLPSDEELSGAAKEGVLVVIRNALNRRSA